MSKISPNISENQDLEKRYTDERLRADQQKCNDFFADAEKQKNVTLKRPRRVRHSTTSVPSAAVCRNPLLPDAH